jgi:hypothetical protein
MTKDEALVQPAPVQSCYCPNCEAMGKELMMLKAHLTEEKKVELATNWFAEDWAITKAVGMLHDYDRLLRKTTPPAAPVQEPVGTYGEIFESMQSLLRSGLQSDQQIYAAMKDKPLYTTPPAAKRQWVGLTLTERNQLCRDIAASTHQVRAIEAKLKEKNT